MAKALIDVTIDNVTNEELDKATEVVEGLLKARWPNVLVELNSDSEYDDEDEDEDEE